MEYKIKCDKINKLGSKSNEVSDSTKPGNWVKIFKHWTTDWVIQLKSESVAFINKSSTFKLTWHEGGERSSWCAGGENKTFRKDDMDTSFYEVILLIVVWAGSMATTRLQSWKKPRAITLTAITKAPGEQLWDQEK